MLCLLLTPVDTEHPGLPTGTFALSSEKNSITSFAVSTDILKLQYNNDHQDVELPIVSSELYVEYWDDW